MAETTELYLIPPPARKLTRAVALAWLAEWAGDYARMIGCGLEAEASAARESYGMLALDARALIEVCARVVQTGKPARLAAYHERSENELPTVLRHLAAIVATRPLEELGPWSPCFDVLSERLVALLAEREAA
jgi:hypothetical protein